MLKKNRPHGHYCKICGQYKANEKFSGKGHAAHICKACSRLSTAEKAAAMDVNRLMGFPMRRLSDSEEKWLEAKMHDKSKVKINEYVPEDEDYEWEMDHLSLKRIIECPYCGAGNPMDFADECDSWSEERQMSSEITYNFDWEECEYPVGTYNYEDI